jgi:hypothetical protein
VAYEGWPLETDPTALAEDATAFLQTLWPEWLPAPGNFDTGSIEAHARMIAELRDVAARMPDEAFLRFGPLAGVPPIEEAFAEVTATWTVLDTQGYTLEAGTVFGLRSTGDTLYRFSVVDDVVILPGTSASAAGGVRLISEDAGEEPNALSGTMELVDRTLPWHVSLVTTAASSGGQTAETVAEYLDRLSDELQLSAPRPILADDFAAFARRDLAVDRAVSVNLWKPGTNEKQSVSHNGTGGTVTLTWSGQTTTAIAWNATATAIRLALEALSNIGVGDVAVTGGPWPAAVTVEFMGVLREADQPAMTASAASLTPGGSTVTITTPTPGVAPSTGVEKYVTTWVVDVNGLDPGQTVRDRVAADLEARRELNFVAPVQAASYDTVNVTYAAQAYPTADPDDVKARADAAVAAFLSPADWGVPPFSEERLWFHDDKVRLSELVEALNRVDGLWRLTGPGANGMPLIEGAAADYTLSNGPAGSVVLPLPGTISGTVTA